MFNDGSRSADCFRVTFYIRVYSERGVCASELYAERFSFRDVARCKMSLLRRVRVLNFLEGIKKSLFVLEIL